MLCYPPALGAGPAVTAGAETLLCVFLNTSMRIVTFHCLSLDQKNKDCPKLLQKFVFCDEGNRVAS